MSRKVSRATELQRLVAASGLPRTEICERLEISKRMLELYLTEQQAIRGSVILAMRRLAEHPADSAP